jgi:hypothetical protein
MGEDQGDVAPALQAGCIDASLLARMPEVAAPRIRRPVIHVDDGTDVSPVPRIRWIRDRYFGITWLSSRSCRISDRFSDDNVGADRSRDQAGRHFELRNHDALVRTLDPRRTSTSQLRGTQAGQHHELER